MLCDEIINVNELLGQAPCLRVLVEVDGPSTSWEGNVLLLADGVAVLCPNVMIESGLDDLCP